MKISSGVETAGSKERLQLRWEDCVQRDVRKAKENDK